MGEAGEPQPQVLVVDDDEDVLDLTRRYFERKGVRVMTTRTPLGVSSLLQRYRPGVLVLDVRMPALDGASLAALVRRARLTRDIPIVFYTGLDADQLAPIRQQFPDAQVVPKGAGVRVLLERVVAVLSEVGALRG